MALGSSAMSMEAHVFFRGKLPTKAVLSRAMKELGFSHVSARPKAYKQDAAAIEAFKKTFPHASPKSARSSHRAHR